MAMMFRKLFKKKATDIVAPMAGKLLSLDQVNDPVFSERAMGDGFAIEFKQGNVYAPVDGEIITVFPTHHAIGIKADDRNEYLIHIGLDTVNFKGEGFKAHVSAGQRIQKGDLLLEVDHPFFQKHQVDMISPVIVTNLNGRKIEILKENEIVTVGTAEILRIFVP